MNPEKTSMQENEEETYRYEKEYGPINTYADGDIKEYHGIVNKWLLVVYGILLGWAVYYLFTYWGGLGPGLAN